MKYTKAFELTPSVLVHVASVDIAHVGTRRRTAFGSRCVRGAKRPSQVIRRFLKRAPGDEVRVGYKLVERRIVIAAAEAAEAAEANQPDRQG